MAIQPVYGPDYGKILMQGLGAYQQVSNMQDRREDRRLSKEKQAREADINAQIAQLTGQISIDPQVEVDPQKFVQLAQLSPSHAAQIQKIRQSSQAQARLEKEQGIQDADRFAKESMLHAGRIAGKSQEEQIRLTQERVADLKKRGIDSTQTEGLLAKLMDPNQYQAVQGIINERRDLGYRTKVLADPKVSTLEQNLKAAGYTPGTLAYQQAARKYMAKSGTTINMGGLGTEKKELAKLRVKKFDELKQRGVAAEDSLHSLDVLDSIDVSTGRAEPMKQAIAAWGAAFGLDTSKLANVAAGDAFTAEAGRTVLNAMAAQKGPQTESDMRQIRTTVSTLGKDPRANKFINNSARALARRTVEQRDFYNEYLSTNETLNGAAKAWNDYKRKIPMISKILKSPEGLPVFYFQFEDKFREDNPTATREDAIEQWNLINKKKTARD